MPLLRDARDSDFEPILRLNLESEEYLSPLSRDRLEALSKEAAYLKVAESDGEVVAFLLAFRESTAYDSENYLWFDSRYDSFLYIDRIVVSSSHQGKRLGAVLYEDFFRFAREQQVPRVTCEFDVEPPNLVSARLHARFGFQEVGSRWLAGGKKRVSLQEAVVLPA